MKNKQFTLFLTSEKCIQQIPLYMQRIIHFKLALVILFLTGTLSTRLYAQGLGKSIQFTDANSVNSVNITTVINSSVLNSSAFTIEAWVKTDNASNYTIISRNNSNNLNEKGWSFNVAQTKLQFQVGSNTGTTTITTEEAVLSSNTWHHVAVTYNKGIATTILYVDGVPKKTDKSISAVGEITSGVVGCFIGKTNDDQTPFKGQIDELKIWDIAKNDFSDSYEPISVPSSTANLRLYYNFEEYAEDKLSNLKNANNFSGTPSSTLISNGIVSTTPVPTPPGFNKKPTLVSVNSDRAIINFELNQDGSLFYDTTKSNKPFNASNLALFPKSVPNLKINANNYLAVNLKPNSTYYLNSITKNQTNTVSSAKTDTLKIVTPNANIDNVATFNGTSTNVKTSEINGFPANNSSRTIEFWIKATDKASQDILSYGSSTSSGEVIFKLIIDSNKKLGFITNKLNITPFLSSDKIIADNSWHHVAITYEESNLNMYIDGNKSSTKTTTLSTGNDLLEIGKFTNSTSSGGALNGSLENLRVWKKALPQYEIQANIAKSFRELEEEDKINDLVLSYSFDETKTSNPVFNDVNPNNNIGTATSITYTPSDISTDNFPPFFTKLTPYPAKVEATRVSFNISLNKPGKVYYLIKSVVSKDPAPTTSQIKSSPTGTLSIKKADSIYSLEKEDNQLLSANSQYNIYFVAEDTINSISQPVVTTRFFATKARNNKIFHVKTNGDNNKSGESWADAFKTVQKAIDLANIDGDEIWVARGTYYPTTTISSNGDANKSFLIISNTEIYGGFAGTETKFEERNIKKNPTTLSGNDKSNHVVTVLGSEAVLNGVTITGGKATTGTALGFTINKKTYSIPTSAGGAIYADSSSIEVTNCIVKGNSSSDKGGAIFYRSSSSSDGLQVGLYNSLFHNNTSEFDGSAVLVKNEKGGSSVINIINSTFSKNKSNAQGSAITFIHDGTSAIPNIQNSIMYGNTSSTGDPDITIAGFSLSSSHFKNNITTNLISGTTGGNNLTGDPEFKNTTNGSEDFSLQAGSIAINKGNNKAIPADYLAKAKDLNENKRLEGDNIDIGAYEFQSDKIAPTITITTVETFPNDLKAKLKATTNESTRVYYVVFKTSDAPSNPEAAKIKSANFNNKVIQGNFPANLNGSQDISGLSDKTPYIVYFVAEDLAENLSTVSSKEFSLDETAPIKASGYPALDPNGYIKDGATINGKFLVKYNEVTNISYVILKDPSTAPTADQIQEGKDSKGNAVSLKGTVNNITTDTEQAISFTGLEENTKYQLYFVAEDNTGNSTAVETLTISPIDLTSPNFAKDYPKVDNIKAKSVDFTVNINEEGNVFYAIFSDTKSTATAEDIKTGTGAAKKATINITGEDINKDKKVLISELPENSNFNLFTFTEDQNKNASAIQKRTFKTRDGTAPTFAKDYPKVDNVKAKSVDFTVNVNEQSSVFYAIFPDTKSTATAEEIKAGTGAVKKATINITGEDINKDKKVLISELSENASFNLFTFAEDQSKNASAIQKRTFKTKDGTAPIISKVSVSTIKTTSVGAIVNVNEVGKIYYAVYGNKKESATVNEIKSGNNSKSKGIINITFNDVNKDKAFAINELEESTSYHLYIAAEDNSGNTTTDANVKKVSFKTKDATAPSFITNYPVISELTSNKVTFKVKTDEKSTVYYVLSSPTIPTVPSVTDVRNGKLNGTTNAPIKGSQSINANEEASLSISEGIIKELDYKVYLVAEDENKNLTKEVKSLTFKIPALLDKSAIKGLKVTNSQPTNFSIQWNPRANAVSYQVEIATDNQFSSTVSGYPKTLTKTTSHEVTNLLYGNSYFVRVKAKFAESNGETAYSSVVTANTTTKPETKTDSTALLQLHKLITKNANSVNWKTKLMRNWNRVTLSADKTRIKSVNMSGLEMKGAVNFNEIKKSFKDEKQAQAMLSELQDLNLSDNELSSIVMHKGLNSLNISKNKLDFDDIKQIKTKGVESLTFSNQLPINFDKVKTDKNGKSIPFEAIYGKSYTLKAKLTHTEDNKYEWLINGKTIDVKTNKHYTEKANELTIVDADKTTQGKYSVKVTNESVAKGLTINADQQQVYTLTSVNIKLLNSDNNVLPQASIFFMIIDENKTGGFDTLKSSLNKKGQLKIDSIRISNYLIGATDKAKKHIPSYYGNTFSWEEADTLKLVAPADATIKMIPVQTESPTGKGEVKGVIYEDSELFNKNNNGRILARRRAKRRKCGLRKRRSGGRTEADKWDLFAYGETDDNGEFQYGFLPEGKYRFFVEFPGIPMDKNSETEFTVGKAGVSQDKFQLKADITDKGVSVDKILGFITKIITNLTIYPNPTNNFATIDYTIDYNNNYKVQLINLAGKVLFEKAINADLHNATLETINYPNGMYILSIVDSNGKSIDSRRVIIKH